MMKNRLVRMAALAGTLVFTVTIAPLSAQESGIALGSRAPTMTLDNMSGKAVNLADFIGKKTVLLEFWATWCGNCKALEPRMLAAHKKYGDQVAIFAIAVPINQTLARVQRYVEEHKYPFPMLWDKDGALAGEYEVPATSYVVVIDKSGKVVYTGSGGTQDLESAIKRGL